jgi:hypothetical protein
VTALRLRQQANEGTNLSFPALTGNPDTEVLFKVVRLDSRFRGNDIYPYYLVLDVVQREW